jgi:DNA-binding XRE family transcriptional regulator
LGTQLRRLREAAGLTQEELAFRAGLTPNAVSDLERGKARRPYPHTVKSLAAALGLPKEERTTLFAVVPRRDASRPEMSSRVPSSTLPSPPTPLVGREQELREIRELLGLSAHGCGDGGGHCLSGGVSGSFAPYPAFGGLARSQIVGGTVLTKLILLVYSLIILANDADGPAGRSK